MEVTGIKCPKCGDEVWSRHRHDFRWCGCKYCAIDGGRSYTKVTYGGPEYETPWQMPEHVTLEVEEIT
jgi:hypothetical protein